MNYKSTTFGTLRTALVVLFTFMSVIAVKAQDPPTQHDCTTSGHPIYSTWNLQNSICSGGDIPFSIGYAPSNTMVLAPSTPSHTPVDTLFLPDGSSCDNGSCVYSSSSTYSSYTNNTVGGANAIKYVKLNIEHGMASDLNIRLVCQNGTRINILKAHETGGGGDCTDAYSSGWEEPYLMSPYCAFGGGTFNQASSDDELCDSSYNPPQAGAIYCWSNKSDCGIQYATYGNGRIYQEDYPDGNYDQYIFKYSQK